MRLMWSGSRGRWGLSRREERGKEVFHTRKQGGAETHYKLVRGGRYHQGSNPNHVISYIPLSSHHRIIATSVRACHE